MSQEIMTAEPAVPAARMDVAESLSEVLADTAVLAMKTLNFHWNVTGAAFHALHAMFKEQYEDLTAAADVLAERVRALGVPAPGTFREFLALASIKEGSSLLSANDMLHVLAADHRAAARSAHAALDDAESSRDPATADILTQRIAAHEKSVWMLESSFKR